MLDLSLLVIYYLLLFLTYILVNPLIVPQIMGTTLTPESSSIKTWAFAISVITFFVTIGSGWATINKDVQRSSTRIDNLDTKTDKIDQKLDKIMDKLDIIQIQMSNKQERK